MKLKKIWFRLKRPAGVMNWRYLLPTNDLSILIHKKSLHHVPKGKSKLLYWGFAFLQQIIWFCYSGWKALHFVWKIRNTWYEENKLVSDKQQFFDLLYLTFGCTIPPIYYYRYQLYLYPKKNWLHFFYDHEVPKLQSMLSGEISLESRQYLTSKSYFAKKSSQYDIPIIPTLLEIKQKQTLVSEQIFQQVSHFYKPNAANRGVGCFLLEYNHENNSYELRAERNKSILTKKDEILIKINQLLEHYDYIRQPLLKNYPSISNLCETSMLVTIRIITIASQGIVYPISAILEPPKIQQLKPYRLTRVDIDTGKLLDIYVFNHVKKNLTIQEEKWIQKAAGFTIPKWETILSVVIKAHQLCLDCFSVGWDVAITPSGVFLLEGNMGWGMASHQIGYIKNNGITERLFYLVLKYYKDKIQSEGSNLRYESREEK